MEILITILIMLLIALLVVDSCDKRLKTIDDRGSFIADDEIGWFFTEVRKIQEALNEFRLR